MGSALGEYSSHQFVHNVGIHNFGVGFSTISQYSQYKDIGITGVFIGMHTDRNPVSYTIQNHYNDFLVSAQEVDFDLVQGFHLQFDNCILNAVANTSDPYAHELYSLCGSGNLYNNITVVDNGTSGDPFLLERGPNTGNTFVDLRISGSGQTVHLAGDSGCYFYGGIFKLLIDPQTGYTGFANVPTGSVTDYGYLTHGYDTYGNIFGFTNSCSGTATLSSGSATVSNSCITGSRPVVCTDQTSAAPVKCTPSSASLSIGGTGSDVISWAQQ